MKSFRFFLEDLGVGFFDEDILFIKTKEGGRISERALRKMICIEGIAFLDNLELSKSQVEVISSFIEKNNLIYQWENDSTLWKYKKVNAYA